MLQAGFRGHVRLLSRFAGFLYNQRSLNSRWWFVPRLAGADIAVALGSKKLRKGCVYTSQHDESAHHSF